jgi:hypothetical protein
VVLALRAYINSESGRVSMVSNASRVASIGLVQRMHGWVATVRFCRIVKPSVTTLKRSHLQKS